MKCFFYLAIALSVASCGSNSSNTTVDPHINNTQALSPSPPDCQTEGLGLNKQALTSSRCNWLSEYRIFSGDPTNSSSVNVGVLPYFLNSTLFTDFSDKVRYIIFPDTSKSNFTKHDVFEFPTGTTLVKVFSVPSLISSAADIIEIRLIIKKETGWAFYPYIWHPESQDAYFYRSGISLEKTINTEGSEVTFNYVTPSSGECGTCHQNSTGNTPIGLKARHLNKVISYEGQEINQLTLWNDLGLISGLPNDLNLIDSLPNWKDFTQPVENRAKAYLDINCAHCHTDGGAGDLSGLRLEYWRKELDGAHGVCNPAHGWRGGGYDIWPGEGDISSITVRMRHTEAKDRMPPIGRSLVDEEAAQLISDWIDTLPYQTCSGV